ncbi:DNA (cytosine-5)-methyltransferase 3A [Labeo rohita]|uniref:DNA (Cytosine-5)-methyltransferase 3A n=1 Tax=Labeo rohita TaxID=84645 RepID=A0ABQ8LNM0_LABRO|nr:DNA (cytosine-5)-methyltransferase 3A [Labeo rohita]
MTSWFCSGEQHHDLLETVAKQYFHLSNRSHLTGSLLRESRRIISSPETAQEVCEVTHEERVTDTPTRRVGRPARKRKAPGMDIAMIVIALGFDLQNSSVNVDSCGRVIEGVACMKRAGCNGETESRVSQNLEQNDSSPDSTHQNGTDTSPGADGDSAPSTPRKKRGRRKLVHPERHVEEDDTSSDTSRGESDGGRLRGRQGWDISLRRRPVQRETFQAGDPYHISRREKEEWLARWRKEKRMFIRGRGGFQGLPCPRLTQRWLFLLGRGEPAHCSLWISSNSGAALLRRFMKT